MDTATILLPPIDALINVAPTQKAGSDYEKNEYIKYS